MDKTLNPHPHWVRIKCPFFKCDSFNSISCEGCTDESYIRQAFGSKFLKNGWQERYCMDISAYRECPINKAVDTKYDDLE